jgi:hypothetical protein
MCIHSQSSLSTFENCPRQYWYQFIGKPPVERVDTIEASLGSRVHDTLETRSGGLGPHPALSQGEREKERWTGAAARQVLRYKNWIVQHLAEGRKVRGIIVAQHISEKVLYFLLSDRDVSVREYEIELRLKDVPELQ